MVATVPVRAGASVKQGGGAGAVLAEELIRASVDTSVPAGETVDAPIRSRTVPKRPLIAAPADDQDTMFADPTPATPEPAAPVPQSPQLSAQYAETPAKGPVVVDKLGQYLRKKKRVTFRMDSGMIRMSVIDVVRSAYSITLVLPLESDGVQFTPAIGPEFEFEADARVDKCSFPGFVTDVEELGLSFLTLVLSTVMGASNEPTKT